MQRRTGVRAGVALISILAVAGCGSSLPSTDLPPTRTVSPAREFPELRDYRGVVDCNMRASGLDQSQLADMAKQAQIDFVVLGDRATKSQSEYGIGGFTGEVLFIPGAAFPIGADGSEIVAIDIHQAIDQSGGAPEI